MSPLAISVKWLQKNVIAKYTAAQVRSSPILKGLQKRIDQISSEEKVQASSLEFDQALKYFGFTLQDDLFELADYELYDPPAILIAMQKEIEFVVINSPKNEAFSRCLFNNIIVSCIAEEKRKAMGEYSAGSALPSRSSPALTSKFSSMTMDPQTPPTRSSSTIETCTPLSLRFETPLSTTLMYKKKNVTISGIAEFTLWFDDDDDDDDSMGTNFICVKVKKSSLLSQADGQVIASMGIVQRARKEEKRVNTIVYGITTDSNQYVFWRLDNNGEVTHSSVYQWSAGQQQRKMIISFIRYAVRAAVKSSPRSSPVKDPKERGITLEIFNDATRNQFIDYGIGQASGGYQTGIDEEGKEVEIWDPSDIDSEDSSDIELEEE